MTSGSAETLPPNWATVSGCRFEWPASNTASEVIDDATCSSSDAEGTISAGTALAWANTTHLFFLLVFFFGGFFLGRPFFFFDRVWGKYLCLTVITTEDTGTVHWAACRTLFCSRDLVLLGSLQRWLLLVVVAGALGDTLAAPMWLCSLMAGRARHGSASPPVHWRLMALERGTDRKLPGRQWASEPMK